MICFVHQFLNRYVELCVWRSDVLQDLTQHFPERSVPIIEVEKDGQAALDDTI